MAGATTEQQFTITDQTGRLDKVLAALQSVWTRSQVDKLIKTDQVTVNGQLEASKYHVNQVTKLSLPHRRFNKQRLSQKTFH